MANETERQIAIAELRKVLTEGQVVYTILIHRARSGMTRFLDVYIVHDNEPRRLTYTVAAAIKCPYSQRHEGIRVHGCGMDAGFALVYELSHAVFGDGYRLRHRWL